MDSMKEVNRYLDHDLSEKEEAIFRKQLSEDNHLKKEVDFIKEVNESITDDEVFFLRQKLSILISNTKTSGIKINKFVFAIAASVALIISILTITDSETPMEVFDAFYSPYNMNLATRSAGSIEQGIDFGLKLYSDKEYEAAYNVLSNYNKSNFDDVSAKYYLGLCAIELNKFDEAESNLKAVVQTNSFGFSLHAKWYLSMLYLKNNREEQARPILEELASSQNFYTQKAAKILKNHL